MLWLAVDFLFPATPEPPGTNHRSRESQKHARLQPAQIIPISRTFPFAAATKRSDLPELPPPPTSVAPAPKTAEQPGNSCATNRDRNAKHLATTGLANFSDR